MIERTKCPDCGSDDLSSDSYCEIVTDGEIIYFEDDIGDLWCNNEDCGWSEKIGAWESYERARAAMRYNLEVESMI